VTGQERACRYVCAATLVAPGGAVARCRGEVRGQVADAPRGSGGFGYDPIFWLPGRGRTMAELSATEKHALSHRARAARCVRGRLQDALGAGAA
jgi:XTP/dITP diphosphohydrolase